MSVIRRESPKSTAEALASAESGPRFHGKVENAVFSFRHGTAYFRMSSSSATPGAPRDSFAAAASKKHKLRGER